MFRRKNETFAKKESSHENVVLFGSVLRSLQGYLSTQMPNIYICQDFGNPRMLSVTLCQLNNLLPFELHMQCWVLTVSSGVCMSCDRRVASIPAMGLCAVAGSGRAYCRHMMCHTTTVFQGLSYYVTACVLSTVGENNLPCFLVTYVPWQQGQCLSYTCICH